MHTISKWTELESPDCSGFEENQKSLKILNNRDILARFVEELYVYEPNLCICICIIFIFYTVMITLAYKNWPYKSYLKSCDVRGLRTSAKKESHQYISFNSIFFFTSFKKNPRMYISRYVSTKLAWDFSSSMMQSELRPPLSILMHGLRICWLHPNLHQYGADHGPGERGTWQEGALWSH